MSYASMKGRAGKPAPAVPQAQLPELTEAQKAQVQTNKDFVLEHLPDALPFIRDLVSQGSIGGWRDVKRCALLDQKSDD